MKLRGILILFLFVNSVIYAQDWANLNRYKKLNAALGDPLPGEKRVVFMGNSITEGWSVISPAFFTGKPYINRGISGQTTPQMLLRFRTDVLELKPAIVVILAGTNDIAGNTGPATPEMVFDNIVSMIELAKFNNIKIILCSVLPVLDYPWSKGKDPVKNIATLNNLLQDYAKTNNIVYVDYYNSMKDNLSGLDKKYSEDGVHPNLTGYKTMEIILEKEILTLFGK